MKSKVILSHYARTLTIVIDAVLIIGCIATFGNTRAFYPMLAILLVLITFGLIYAPMTIEADSSHITVVSALKRRRIQLAEIESAELFRPTMGAVRICASGGYMGYWGIFRESDIGRYAAFYGRASDCFLLRMKNGDKYVLGCEDPDTMLHFIKSHCAHSSAAISQSSAQSIVTE